MIERFHEKIRPNRDRSYFSVKEIGTWRGYVIDMRRQCFLLSIKLVRSPSIFHQNISSKYFCMGVGITL